VVTARAGAHTQPHGKLGQEPSELVELNGIGEFDALDSGLDESA
jgi:hypothetical protein